MKDKIAVVLLLFALTGCVSDEANRYYSDQHYPSRPAAEVAILSGAPGRAYDVLADFQSRGDTPQSLQKKAAEIGADAIIVTRLGGLYNPSEQWASNDSESGSGNRIVGTAIKYKQ